MPKKKIVYTSLPSFIWESKKCRVRSFELLPIYSWAKRRIEEMSGRESSSAERKFLSLCKAFRFNLFRQVFFQIGGKAYFLDFFLPSKNIAIEIDGPYHNTDKQKEYDKKRDEAFASIGIRTIRFTVEEMLDPEFYIKYYCPRLQNLGYKIRPKKEVSTQQRQLMDAIKIMENSNPKEVVEFQCKNMCFLQSISHSRPSEKSRNLVLLARFYELKREKKIHVRMRFIGAGDKMRKHDRKMVTEWAAKCDRSPIRRVVVIE